MLSSTVCCILIVWIRCCTEGKMSTSTLKHMTLLHSRTLTHTHTNPLNSLEVNHLKYLMSWLSADKIRIQSFFVVVVIFSNYLLYLNWIAFQTAYIIVIEKIDFCSLLTLDTLPAAFIESKINNDFCIHKIPVQKNEWPLEKDSAMAKRIEYRISLVCLFHLFHLSLCWIKTANALRMLHVIRN